MRGEYYLANDALKLLGELPPRARRIQNFGDALDADPGTTSACAENTEGGVTGRDLVRNYLRVRGEYPK